MNFYIPDSGGAYLPKEIAKEVVNLAVEQSLILKLFAHTKHIIDVTNEKTVVVTSSADDDKMYYLEDTADVTTLGENTVGIKGATLAAKELGGWFFLSDKTVRRFKAAGNLDNLIKGKISRSMSRTLEKIALVGDVTKTGTDPLRIANGIYTIAASATLCNLAPQTFTAENTQGIVNAVIDAKAALGAYAENNDNLVILAGRQFYANAKKNASTLVVGFDLMDYPLLGLTRIPFIDGTPVILRLNLPDKDAVLMDYRGGFVGYETTIQIEKQRWAGKRGYDNVITATADFTWAYINASDKAEGLILIQDVAS